MVSEKGAVDNIEVARKEWARADGWIETNPGLKMEPDTSTLNDFKGQLELLQEAKNEIENFGPNPALIGQGLEDSSGRAIQLLQQAGIAELGPYLTAYKNWKIRVYRDIWNIIQRHWRKERWIRVTDDMNVAQFFQVNKMEIDQNGRPVIVNALGALDVDIIIDEGPDTINMQGDAMIVLQSLGPQFLQEFPEIALELAPLPSSVKKPMMDRLEQKKNQPPPPDPKVLAMQAKSQLDAQTAQREAMQAQQEDQRAAAMAQQDAALKQRQAEQDMALQVRQQQMDQMAREAEARQEAMLARMKANADAEIERMKAAAQVEIARFKASNDAQIAADKHDQQMQMEKERAENEPAPAK